MTETDGLNYVVVKTNDGNVTINFTGGPLSFTASTDVLNASGVPVTFETTGGGIKLGDVDVGSSAASITAFGAIQDDSNNSTVVRGGTVTLKAGTGIGAVGNEIDTDVMTLTATTTSGVIQIREANALTLSATTSSGNIDVRNTTGDLTLLTVSTTGNATLHAGGAILDGNANSNNVSANMLELDASNGVGASTDVLETSVSSLTAPSGLGGGLFLSNSKALNLDSVTATGSVSVATTGNLTVGTITAEDQSVTLSATGELIDSNGPTLNITAASATLNGSKIGTSSDKFETSVATLTAATSSGGLFVSDFGTTSLTLTATAIGQGADIDIDGAGDIVLETATAQGDTVKLNAAGKILDGNDTPTTKPVNITANTLDIAAPGGIGTPTNQLEVNVNQVLGADGGAGGGSVANSGPLAIKEEALEKSGSGELVFDAESITILNIADNTATVASGRSVVFRTQMGNIVFLDPADTIQASGAGGITVQAGLVSGSGAVAVLGNLKTSGGAIIVSADRNITIGLLDAGAGSVSVISKAGVIVDGNGPSLNIIGGAATVSGVTPTARQAELNEINKIADAAGTRAEAAAKQTSFEAFNAGSVITDAAQTSSASAVARAADDVAVKTEIASAKEDTADSRQLRADIAAGVSQGLVIAADVVLVVASVAQAIPLTGDGGAFSVAAGLTVAADVAGAVAFGLQIAADIAAGEATDAAIAEAKAEAQLFAARSTLELATSTANAFKESTSIAKAAAEKAAIARDAAARVSDQATLARDQANALGTAAEPLGIQATGPVTITAGQSDIFLQLVGPTTLGNVTATGADKTIEVSATGNITIQGTISSPTQVRIDTSSGAIVNGGGKISALEFVATATAGVGTSGPLATMVDKIAISGGTGGVNISNTGNLEVTTIDGVVGVAATGAGIAIHVMGSITVTQPVAGTGACTVLLDAKGGNDGDLFVNNVVSTVNGTLGLKATDDIVSNASGRLVTTSGAVALTADSDNTDGGTITYTATVNHGSAGSTWSLSDTDGTMSAVISGTGPLTKTGTGTLTLSAANTYTGDTIINQGSLALSGGAAIANSVAVKLTVTGADLTLNNSETIGSLEGVAGTTVTLGDQTLTTGGNNNTTLYAGAIGGLGGKLTKLGTGTFTLSGTNNYTGLTTISGGTLALTGGSAIADTEPGSGAVSINVAGANMLLNDSETIGSLSGVTGSTVMLGNKLLTTGDASSTTFAGVISGNGGTLTKQGSGTFTLSGTNTYTGVTTVRAGTLALSGGSAILDTVAVNLSEAGADLTLNDSETIGSLTGVTDTTVTLGDQTLTTGFNDTSTSYAGAIGGTGGLTKVGTGTFTLTGVNTYTGLTTISGGTLALSGGAAIADTEPGSGAVSINVAGANLLLNDSETIGSLSGVDGTTVMLGDQLLTTGDASDTTFAGVISGDGGTLTKQGSGTFTLSGVNTYTGVTTVSAGTLALGASNALADASKVTVNGGTFDIGTFSDTVAEVLLTEGSITGTTGVLTSTTNYDVRSGLVSAILGGTVGLDKSTAGTVTLSGTNTYTGTTTISAGTLALSGGTALEDLGQVILSVADANLTLNASETVGSLSGVAGTTVTLGANTLTAGGNDGTTTYAGVIDGTGGLTKIGSGTLTLSGENTYTGATTINAGTLTLGAAGGVIADSSAVTVANGTTFNLANNSETVGSIAGAGLITLGSATLTAGGNDSSTTFSGVISGTGALTKEGTGTLTLSGTNTYTGTTTVSAGSLALSGGTALEDLGQVILSDAGADLTLNASETVGSLSGVAGTTVTLGANTLTAGGNNGTTTYAGVIGGTGGLTKIGSGTLTLSGANTYSGTTTVSAGTLALGVSNSLANDSELLVNGGSFSIGTFSDTVNEVHLTEGSITGTTGVLTSLTNYDLRMGLVSAILNGTAGLDKTTAGTVTLTGANTYTGATTISAGRLDVNGSTAAGSVVSVQNTATLGGTGTVFGTVNVQSGGTVSPGTSPGVLNTTIVNFLGGSTFAIDIGGTTPGNLATNYDQLVVAGNNRVTNLGGAELVFALSAPPAAGGGQVYKIIDSTGTMARVAGTFKYRGITLSDGDTLTVDRSIFRINYNPRGAAGDVILTAVPATTQATLSADGTLTITDIGAASSDKLTLSLDAGGNVVIHDPKNAIGVSVGVESGRVALTALTKIVVNTGVGSDSLLIDFTNGNPIPSGGLAYDAGVIGGGRLPAVEKLRYAV